MPDETAAEEIATAALDVVRRIRSRRPETVPNPSKGWRAVAAAVERHVSKGDRPDIYGVDEVNLRALFTVGLSRAARLDIREATLAAEFAAWCLRPLVISQDWILLDANLPRKTTIPLGDYVLFTPTAQELLGMHPLRCLADENESDLDLPPGALGESAFLSLDRPDRPVRSAVAHAVPLGGRIELEHWKPLLVLALWSPAITRAECMYEVDRGRRIDIVSGVPNIVLAYTTSEHGEVEDVYQKHDRLGMTIGPGQTSAFTAFSAVVLDRVEQVMAGATGKYRGQKKLARRLQAAGTHLLRATHRTRGPEGAHEVSAYELNEVLLHYVIAIEALLADDHDHLDLSRKVQYRAATLFATDEQRTYVAKLMGTAYAARSKYVHGDAVAEGEPVLGELRRVVRAVLLRWLILTVDSDGRLVSEAQTLPTLLDRATLSDQVRREEVLRPIEEFLTATPAADSVTVG